MYWFEDVLFDAEFESALLGLSDDVDETFSSSASSLTGTMMPPTEVSEDEREREDKDAPVSGANETPIWLGLAPSYMERVCFDLQLTVSL
ncbi:hypothetical protein FIBSPDRAFT_74503 [Athelia psychrophila]|uniref:Uncharacterized protein n=1 Tax=Athelia psychrophila TaxID=1759441 RepID=A0A166DNX1_9AGAM|nr:hypothetical protein FIBSPDRAFT_97074 [Fibularhizoctonia sp. CBS 109695]KZP15951.1 hypothetical protein FIBSPDRAFT_74503 [Fibularhizoctonia sp. CBS 109695]